jgi:hypothetical protein
MFNESVSGTSLPTFLGLQDVVFSHEFSPLGMTAILIDGN